MVIDVGFFFGKLVPIGVNLFSNMTDTVEIDGGYIHHHKAHGGSVGLLYALTILVALSQIIFTVFIIFAIHQMGTIKIYNNILDGH